MWEEERGGQREESRVTKESAAGDEARDSEGQMVQGHFQTIARTPAFTLNEI